MKHLVTVIVPVYNVEQYLPSCLNSIAKQTYKELQIILVDDGSTDSSGDICDAFKMQDNRVEVIHKKNGGPSSARNCALDLAKGDYVTFVDSDDIIDTRMIEQLHAVIGNEIFSMCGNIKFEDDVSFCPEDVSQVKLDKKQYYTRMRNNPDYIVVWGKLFRIDVFKDIRFAEGIINEDEEIMPRIVYLTKKVPCITAMLYGYRIRKNSIMNSGYSHKSLDIITVCERRIDVYKKLKMYDMYAWSVKDYYSHLVKLRTLTQKYGTKDEIELVTVKMQRLSDYTLPVNIFLRIKYKYWRMRFE